MFFKKFRKVTNEVEAADFSQRPSYDPNIVDAVFSKYCGANPAPLVEKAVVTHKGGIDITRRKDAILKSLQANKLPVQIFGELEKGLFNNNI